MDLSIVIPCYNAEDTLGQQLDALAQQEWGGTWEVIVADNGSGDRSLELVRSYQSQFEQIRIVDASARLGPAYARNVGALEAQGRNVAFVDADDVVAPGWVAAIGDALSGHEFVASRHDARRLNPEWLVESRGQAQFEGLQTLWYPPYLPHAGGCGLGVRRSLLEEYGGFDEELRCLQDTDLCLRLQRQGVKLVFVPEATVYVRFHAGTSGMFRQARMWAEHNDLVYKRYRPEGMKIPHPWRLYWRGWKRIARRINNIGDRRTRYHVVWQTGWHFGLLLGSIKHRVAPAVWVPEHWRPEPVSEIPATLGVDQQGQPVGIADAAVRETPV